MNRYRGWLTPLILIAFCIGGVWLTIQATASYPTLGKPVFYPVNQVQGFELTIEEPFWSPFTGYTIRYEVSAESAEIYYLTEEGEDLGFEFLERCVDGQWYRLEYSQKRIPFSTTEFALGGEESTGFGGNIVQKYAYYGTRLETGVYRFVLEMKAEDGTPHYLAAEFQVE